MTLLERRMQRDYSRWLDLLRGIGVIMMIANHYGYGLLSREGAQLPVCSAIVTTGSFAPVLFFLTTGLGIGLHRERSSQFARVMFKAVLLFAADAIMMLVAVRGIGCDFLAFIALSTLVCSMLTGRKHAVAIAIVAFILVAGLRFVVGPAIRTSVSSDSLQSISIVLGVKPVVGFGYPPAPWLCFPLLGFFLSPLVENRSDRSPRLGVNGGLFAVGAACLAAACAASWHGSVFVRYSTMSATYFVAAIGVSLFCVVICIELDKVSSPFLAARIRFFETRGVACLSIVPIHYLLLELLRTFGMRELATTEFVAVLVVTIPICLMFGRGFEHLARALIASAPRRIVIIACSLIVTTAALLCIIPEDPLQRMFGLFFGQLALCVLLAGVDSWIPKRSPGKAQNSIPGK